MPGHKRRKPRGRDTSAARPMVLLPIMLFVAGATFLLMREQAGKNGHAPLTRYIPIIVVALLLFIRLLPVLFDKSFGTIGLVQIFSPEFEQRIRARYQSETEQLSSIGFDLLFFVGDSTSIFRLALIFPAIVVLHMKRNRVPMTIQNGTTLLTGNPVFISRDKTAYAHPNSLGFTFHTRFQDGTILVSKNFGEDSGLHPLHHLQCLPRGQRKPDLDLAPGADQGNGNKGQTGGPPVELRGLPGDRSPGADAPVNPAGALSVRRTCTSRIALSVLRGQVVRISAAA